MEDELPPAAPAGWYPLPGGGQRYWDGQKWLQLSPPPSEPPDDLGGEQKPAPGTRRRQRALVAAGVLLVAITVTGITAYSIKSAHDARQTAAEVSQEAKSRAEQSAREKAAADAAASAVADQKAQEERKAREAKEAKAAEDKAELALRKASVRDIEASVKKMAKQHARTGLIDGPIAQVSCDPVAGGSLDDLNEKTTVFQCFAVNQTNKDGTMSGYYYNATMNWSSGTYTYGFGKP